MITGLWPKSDSRISGPPTGSRHLGTDTTGMAGRSLVTGPTTAIPPPVLTVGFNTMTGGTQGLEVVVGVRATERRRDNVVDLVLTQVAAQWTRAVGIDALPVLTNGNPTLLWLGALLGDRPLDLSLLLSVGNPSEVGDLFHQLRDLLVFGLELGFQRGDTSIFLIKYDISAFYNQFATLLMMRPVGHPGGSVATFTCSWFFVSCRHFSVNV